jgi:hypothetical protein
MDQGIGQVTEEAISFSGAARPGEGAGGVLQGLGQRSDQ